MTGTGTETGAGTGTGTGAGTGAGTGTETADRGRRYAIANAVALGVAAALGALGRLVPATPQPLSERFDPAGFASSARWDDGRAEVARYSATRTVHGPPQSYELVQIVAKEARGGFESLKLVRVLQIPADRAQGSRRTLALRVARSDPRRVLDASVTSQEWAGSAFVLVVPRGAALVRHVHSTLDGEGDREDILPGGTWLEDQLALTLRALPLARGETHDVALLPSLLSNSKPRDRATRPARIRVEDDETMAGRRCARIAVESGNARSTLWIARDDERTLVRADDPDGSRVELRSIERTACREDGK